jgi:hypothetical protein
MVLLKSLEKTRATFVAEYGAKKLSSMDLPLFLRGKNADVAAINAEFFAMLPAEGERVFTAQDQLFQTNMLEAGVSQAEVMKTLSELTPAVPMLALRLGARVIYLGRPSSGREVKGLQQYDGHCGPVCRDSFARGAARQPHCPLQRF